MNYQEGLHLIEFILPMAVGMTLVGLAFVGMREFWHECAVACKGGFQ